MTKTLFRIETGKFGLELIDPAAPGYNAAWQTPAGKTIDVVRLADYDPLSASFACQIVTGVLTATESVTTEQIDGTWCDLPESKQIVGEDTFAVAWDAYQDPNDTDGLAAWCFTHRGSRAWLYFGAGGDGVPPVAVGIVTIKALGIGGGRTYARSQVTFPFDRTPDVMFGTAAKWTIVYGDRTKAPTSGGTPAPIAPTGATAGAPGTWTPAGAAPPADLAALTGHVPAIVATPTTAWTVGQSVALGTGEAHWDGSGWVTGKA